MKKIFYFILLISLASCEEEQVLGPSGNVNLNISALFAGQPLAMDQPYLFGNTDEVKFDQFNFFISSVTLLEAETDDETDLLEVALVDFADGAQPKTFAFNTVPAVKYRGIKIGIGVPSGLNKASVQNFGAGHPLKQNFESHFWEDGGSFFFMKLAGVFADDQSFELFPAKNGNFETVELVKSFTLGDGETVDLDLTLDLLKLLQTADFQTIDLADPANHSTYDPENDDLSKLLMGNFGTALEIEL